MKFALISLLFLGFSYYSNAFIFDPKAVDALLREIRARLQATSEDPLAQKVEQKAEEINKEEAEVDVEGSGSGEEVEGSGMVESTVTGVPIMEEEKEQPKESFPRPEPIFDRFGNLKSKDQLEAVTFNNFKKQAPLTLQDHYNLNPKGTLQMLQGLDIHGV